MAQITYLLGAGASYNAIPVVSDMAKRIGETIEWLENLNLQYDLAGRLSTEGTNRFLEVLSDLDNLKDACDTSKNFSIDTYAKKLKLSGLDDEYRKLKNILSLYFTIEQKRKLPDVRYDNFWASILKHKSMFPKNVKIMSWNYDFQLELTYKDFIGVDSLNDSRKSLNVISTQTSRHDLDFPEHFGIFKLNGSATFNNNRESGVNYLIDEFSSTTEGEFIVQSFEIYSKMCKNGFYNNHLSFAWEHKTQDPFYNHLKAAVSDTEILVVIGYSFPFFNRDIDKLILNDFMGNTLHKVYFQAPENDVEDLRERFLAINNRIDPSQLLLRKDIKQFTLPNEL